MNVHPATQYMIQREDLLRQIERLQVRKPKEDWSSLEVSTMIEVMTADADHMLERARALIGPYVAAKKREEKP